MDGSRQGAPMAGCWRARKAAGSLQAGAEVGAEAFLVVLLRIGRPEVCRIPPERLQVFFIPIPQ